MRAINIVYFENIYIICLVSLCFIQKKNTSANFYVQTLIGLF